MKKTTLILALIAGIALGAGTMKLTHYRNRPTAPAPNIPDHRESFSQCGEDLIIENIFYYIGIKNPTYIDIGAAYPKRDNNTYYFYRSGSRGVLVEPNPAMYKDLVKERNGDTVLNCGIGTSEAREVDYYIIGPGDGSAWNTFSKEAATNAEKLSEGTMKLNRVIKMPLMTVGNIFETHFNGKAPDLFSIDVEGMEMPILKTIDFRKYRPAVFCIETLLYNKIDTSATVTAFMRSKNYSLKGSNFINLIFVDNERLAKVKLITR